MEEIDNSKLRALLRGKHNIYVHGSASTPHCLLEMLRETLSDEMDIGLYHIELSGEVFLFDKSIPLPSSLKDYSLFVGSNARESLQLGRTNYIPIFLSEIPWLLRTHIHPDITFINVSSPDEKGFVSLGPTIEGTKVAIEESKYIIAQINDEIPRTFGDATLSMDRITQFAKCDQKPDLSWREPLDAVDRKIGGIVSSLIPDGATIQAGIGKIPDAAMSFLKDRKHLGIHTELLSDGMIELIQTGAVDNTGKATDRYHVTTTFSKGEEKLFDFINDNPMILMKSVEYTNDTSIIRQNPMAHSINSAVEVDLTGQVSAESIGTRIISGVGGQMDFVRGSSLSPGGKSIIAMRSVTKSGKSKIVPILTPGAGVTTTRNHVQFVVTEYGIADLRGKSINSRIDEMISIAEPSQRPFLVEEARKLYNYGESA